MSIHPSLSSSLKNRKQRSVLKRLERIKYFMNKGSFNEQRSVFGLPKIKSVKIKVKKEKVEEKAAVAGATAAAEAAPVKAEAASSTSKTSKPSSQAKSPSK